MTKSKETQEVEDKKESSEIVEKEEPKETKPKKSEDKKESKTKKSEKKSKKVKKNIAEDLDETLGLSGSKKIDTGDVPDFMKLKKSETKAKKDEIPNFIKY